MALRLLASKRLASATTSLHRNLVGSGSIRFSSNAALSEPNAAPTVSDVTIKLNFIDPSGARRQVPGLIGKNLHEICEMHDIDIGPASNGGPVEAVRSDTWTEPLYGEGPTSGFDHVLLVGNGVETAPPLNNVEMRMLKHYWDEAEIFPESRLASQITLTKAMDGMTVYVPDRLVDDIP
mmetsp:Transcript_20008/g.29486  ORF Transcript_20008/g.29486 Transcript_20008/m.29486 type:complete len:179 (+) Transcript_20008:198-734(+)